MSLKYRQAVRLNDEVRIMRENLAVLERSGLKKSASAKELLAKSNDLLLKREELLRQADQEQRECTAHLLLCIAAADFACEAADLLQRVLKNTYGTIRPGEHEYIKLLDGLARDMGGLVTIIDKVRDDRFSYSFADMSDEIMDTMTAANLERAMEIVAKHDQGNNIRFRPNDEWRKMKEHRNGSPD